MLKSFFEVNQRSTYWESVHRSTYWESLLTTSELKDAKKYWELYIQQKNFREAYKALQTNQRNTLKEQLGLKLDEDSLIRCRGSFVNVKLPEEVKYPKLLPRKQHFKDLIIESYHKGLLHAGVTHTLSQLRHEYWIPHGRTEVKRVLRKCTICCRHEGGPYKMPPMAPWPKSRVMKWSPLTFVGLDYLGPLYIKESAFMILMSCRMLQIKVLAGNLLLKWHPGWVAYMNV